MGNTEIHTSWPKHMVKPCDLHWENRSTYIDWSSTVYLAHCRINWILKRAKNLQLVSNWNYYCYLILVQGLVENHSCGFPELLTCWWGFCDIQNNEGWGKGYQPKPNLTAKVRLITLTETLNVLDITKTESNNCFIIHRTKKMEVMFLLLYWNFSLKATIAGAVAARQSSTR